MAQTAAQRAEKLTVRYAEGLAEIDAGAGPGWAADLAAAVRAGERPSAFARRTERDRSSVYAALNDPHRDKARKRKGTFVCSDCAGEFPSDRKDHPMNAIVEAIDAEIETHSTRLAELHSEEQKVEERIAALDQLRQGAVALNGAGPASDSPATIEAPKPEAKAKPKKQAAPKKATGGGKSAGPSAAVQKARGEAATEQQRKVLAYVREHGEITYAQAAKLLGVSLNTAKKKLIAIARSSDLKAETGKRPEGVKVGRPPKVYRLEATAMTTDDDGAKTSVERRVVQCARERGEEVQLHRKRNRSDWPEIERLYHQGLTYREIGERIGDSLEGVGNKVARMREVGYDLPTRWRSRTVA